MSYKKIRTENGIELNHNVVMEKKIGRPIKKKEVVHHIDNDKTNDSPENLYLCECNRIHSSLHTQFNNLIRKFGIELLKRKIIKFNRKLGIYYLPNHLNMKEMNLNLQQFNPTEEDIYKIIEKRKIIIEESNEPKINYWDTPEGRLTLKQINEIDEKNRRKWALEQDKIMLDNMMKYKHKKSF